MVVFGGDLGCPIVSCHITNTNLQHLTTTIYRLKQKKFTFPRCYCFKRPKTAIQFLMVIFFSLCRSTDHQTCFSSTPFLAIQSMNRSHHQTPTKFCQFLLAWLVLCHFFVLLFHLKRAIGSNSLPLATPTAVFSGLPTRKKKASFPLGLLPELPAGEKLGFTP